MPVNVFGDNFEHMFCLLFLIIPPISWATPFLMTFPFFLVCVSSSVEKLLLQLPDSWWKDFFLHVEPMVGSLCGCEPLEAMCKVLWAHVNFSLLLKGFMIQNKSYDLLLYRIYIWITILVLRKSKIACWENERNVFVCHRGLLAWRLPLFTAQVLIVLYLFLISAYAFLFTFLPFQLVGCAFFS